MNIKNVVIVAAAAVVTVFLSTIAFNLANDPGEWIGRVTKISERKQIAKEETDLRSGVVHSKWQMIVDEEERKREKEDEELHKRLKKDMEERDKRAEEEEKKWRN